MPTGRKTTIGSLLRHLAGNSSARIAQASHVVSSRPDLGWRRPVVSRAHYTLADSGGGGGGGGAGPAGGARPPPFEIPKRVFKEGQRGRTPPAPPPLLKFQRGSSNGTAAAPPLSTNPGSAPVIGGWFTRVTLPRGERRAYLSPAVRPEPYIHQSHWLQSSPDHAWVR